jgi:nucleotide-binding universal stress UspA family protein
MGSPVVVGVDGSDSCMLAVGWAAAEAARRGTTLRLVHACEVPSGYPAGIVDRHVLVAALAAQGRDWLTQAQEVAERAVDGLVPEVVTVTGSVAVTLLKESRSAALLVLGSRGLGGITGLLVGSASVELAAHAHCPVVVVRGRDTGVVPPVDGPVVVGVDGTPAGEAAIAFAFEEASLRRAELVAVHAWTELVLETAFAGSAAALDFAPLEQLAAETLAERLAGWREKYPDVRVTPELVRERPTHALLSRAEHAQLVVVGSRGRGGFTGLLLGSTSQHLLQHASCPVAVVRTGSPR